MVSWTQPATADSVRDINEGLTSMRQEYELLLCIRTKEDFAEEKRLAQEDFWNMLHAGGKKMQEGIEAGINHVKAKVGLIKSRRAKFAENVKKAQNG